MTEQPTSRPTPRSGEEPADALADGQPVDVYRDPEDGRRYGKHPWGFTLGYDETADLPPTTAERRADGLEGK